MSNTFKRSRSGHPYNLHRTASDRVHRVSEEVGEPAGWETEFPELNSIRHKGSDVQDDPRPVREAKRTVRPAYWRVRD